MRMNMKRSNGMANQKAHRFRMDGMAMALRIVEERGVEGLREEVKTRTLCSSRWKSPESL